MPTPREILDLAVQLLEEEPKPGSGPAGPLSRKIGLSYQRVYRWLEEGNGPDAEGLVAILEAYDWINIGEDGPVQAQKPLDPLTKLALVVEETGETQKTILREVRAVKREVQRLDPQADPKPKTARERKR